MQRHMGTKPEFSAPHSLQIVPTPTTSPLPAQACAGGQPQVSSQLKQKAPGLEREGKGPLQVWEVGPGESALEHAAPWEGDLDCLGGKRVERCWDSLKFDALTPCYSSGWPVSDQLGK